MKPKKDKYLIWTRSGQFTSNSRNARKHLIEQYAFTNEVWIFSNTKEPHFVCMAVIENGCILVGTKYNG